MALYGFSRRDIAKHLSEFAKRELVVNYPEMPTSVGGLGDFKSGHQGAKDPEIYMFRSDDGIPAATVVDITESGDVKVECTNALCKIYKPIIRDRAEAGQLDQDVNVERLKTVEDGAALSSYGTATYRVYNTHTTAIPSNTMSLCVVVGGQLFALPPSEKQKRIKFRLKEGFNDRGAPVTVGSTRTNALAYVIDQWGCDGLALNTIVEVCDPRKCFAHAIGSDDLSGIQGVDSFLPAGGSIGYAVMTYDIDTSTTCDNCETPTSDCEPANCYPRWEVEQCTQVINRMKVYVDRAETGVRPTGELGEGFVTLRVVPDEAVASHWPYVDYPPELIAPDEYRTYWSIRAMNPHRFSAGDGWAIIERVRPNSRAEDAENVCVPYPAGATPEETVLWQIVEVENPIARWLCAQYINTGGSQEPDMQWQFTDVQAFQEGENPVTVNYFSDYNELNSKVRTHPCLEIDCLKPLEPGIAFWNPNDQFYNIISTNSSLYGKAREVEVVGQFDTDGTQDPLIKFGETAAGEDPCDLIYKKLEPIKVFGGNENCPAETTDETADANLEPVDVVSNVTRPYLCTVDGTVVPAGSESECNAQGGTWAISEELCFTYDTIYVCRADPGVSDDCINVCCDEPTGCCEYPPGTYTDGVTQSECDAQGGDWTAACPEDVCIECSQCPDTPIRFADFALSWSNVATGNPQGPFNGEALQATVEWTQDDDCCAALSVTLHSDDPLIPDTPVTATVCVEPAGVCINSMWQVTLNWSQATFAGVTLPTVMCGGQSSSCAGNYGKQASSVVPNTPDNGAGGTWDEADILIAACTP